MSQEIMDSYGKHEQGFGHHLLNISERKLLYLNGWKADWIILWYARQEVKKSRDT